MIDKWEMCYIRPPVPSGAEMAFFHPESEKSKVFRNLKEFVAEKKIKLTNNYQIDMAVVCFLLSEGWEPLTLHAISAHDYAGASIDFGVTGYAFKRKVLT